MRACVCVCACVCVRQIVKSAEPAFAALLGVTLYNKKARYDIDICLYMILHKHDII